ncbi:MAG TPA: hypothetical protein VHC97_02905 [Thermoanaerobaculia bacterium]|nr:hypothetical protein [Thermoanaerobaculia bacterium]
MAYRIALALLALASAAALVAFCVGGPLGPWLAVLAGGLFPVSLIALGATRGGSLGRLKGPVLILGIVLAAGLALVVFLPEGGPDILGLPLGTALMIFVVVPLPLLLTCLAYALTFDRLGLRPEDLDRVRASKERD